MQTSRKPEKLVVDANPILSALLGGKAKQLFLDADISEFAVTESALDEVHYYIPKVAQKLEVNPTLVRFTLDLLPLTVYKPNSYRRSMKKAKLQIAHRDPQDIEILALALELGRPLWTNDKDFEDTTIQTFTTAELLSIYFPKPS
ncbi:MAG: PIN domain-containing protein [Nitrospira sp.]|nr:PIN domain-containing protein [Nitrospira sp.]